MLFHNRVSSFKLPILGNLRHGRCGCREVDNLLLLIYGVFVRKRTDNFADYQVTQTVAIVKRPSQSLTFGHIFVLEALGNSESIFISHRHYLILEELHLLDNFDELVDLLGCALVGIHRCKKFNCPLDVFACRKFVADFVTKNVTCHQIHSKIDLDGCKLVLLLLKLILLSAYRCCEHLGDHLGGQRETADRRLLFG